MKNDLTLLPIRNAQVSYAESIPFVRSAEVLLQELIAQIEWEHKDVVIQGRSYKQPRLTAWHADPGMAYTYSGLANQPQPRTEAHKAELPSLMRNPYAGVCMTENNEHIQY